MSVRGERAGRELRDLARIHGVQLAYRNVTDGAWKRASPESLLAVLRALGAPVQRIGEAGAALAARRAAILARSLEPVAVAWNAHLPKVAFRLPESESRGRVRVALELEDGGTLACDADLRTLPARLAIREGGVLRVTRDLPVPGPMPLGYHRLVVEASGRRHSALVIAAPSRPAGVGLGRTWGLFLPLYAARATRGATCGTLSDLGRLLDIATRFGGRLVQTLPLLAAFLDRPFDPSPYAPASRLYWNELYVDPDRLPTPTGRRRRPAVEAHPGAHVDYRRVAARRREALAASARAFFDSGGARDAGFRRFCAVNPSLEDYARFRATVETRQAPWPAWPERLREGDLRSGDYEADAARYHRYAQWRFEEQLGDVTSRARERGAALVLDLPLGTHPDGYDVWRHRALFAPGVSGGAPPDHYSRFGQSWGFPPLHPDRIREDGYAYVAAAVRLLLRHAGVLRVDHVMSLHRLYWVPAGTDGRSGVYVRYRPEETYAVLALEAERAGAVLVGEDLGTVPAEVRPAMARHGIARTFALQRAVSAAPRRALASVPPGSFASFNTHDHPTFAGFWRGLDVDDRVTLGMLDAAGERRERLRRMRARTGLIADLRARGHALGRGSSESTIYTAALCALGASRARAVIVNLEDLWGETRPQNVPNTTVERPNWRRRARRDLATVARSPKVAAALAALDRSRRKEATR